MVPFLLVSAVVPSMLLIWFFHSRDVYPEPQRVVWATFGLGVAIVIPVVIVELIISAMLKHVENPFLNGTLEGFFCAGLTEELFKYGIVTLFCMRHKEFDEPMDGIVYGAVASLGFATLENILYVSQGGGGAAVMRALSAVPCHASMGAVMGYFVGQAKFNPQKRTKLMALGFFVPMLLHGAYDAPLLTAARLTAEKGTMPKESAGLAGLFLLVTLATLVGEVTWAIVLSGRLRREQQVWHSARWAAWYAGRPPPPPPWFGGLPTQPVWTYATSPGQQAGGPTYPAAQPLGQSARVQAQGGESASSAVLSWLMLGFGGVVATFGGLMGLGSMVILASPERHASDGSPGTFLAVGLLFGLLPLVVGVGLFFFGIKRLVAVTPQPPPRAYPVYGT